MAAKMLTRVLKMLLHNCVVHPLCDALWLIGADRLADRLHDQTVP